MTVDRYTKAVLTVIAVCLVWLSFGGRSPVTPVAAQGSERVVITGWMDENGLVRPLPAAPNFAAGKPVPGQPTPPAGLPIWNINP